MAGCPRVCRTIGIGMDVVTVDIGTSQYVAGIGNLGTERLFAHRLLKGSQ